MNKIYISEIQYEYLAGMLRKIFYIPCQLCGYVDEDVHYRKFLEELEKLIEPEEAKKRASELWWKTHPQYSKYERRYCDECGTTTCEEDNYKCDDCTKEVEDADKLSELRLMPSSIRDKNE
jgi:hypothetical protein